MSLLSGTQSSGADASANNDKDNRQDSAGEKIKSCAAATDEGTSHPRVMQAAVIEVRTMWGIFFKAMEFDLKFDVFVFFNLFSAVLMKSVRS